MRCQAQTFGSKKPDLAHQINALESYCKQREISVDEWMSDIGSGLNYKRQQVNRLLEMVELGQVRRMVIAHRDRLADWRLVFPSLDSISLGESPPWYIHAFSVADPD